MSDEQFNPAEHTVEEILADIRRRLTPKYDKYAAPRVILELSNTGWAAYDIDAFGSHIEEYFATAHDAASALWQWWWDNLWCKQGEK